MDFPENEPSSNNTNTVRRINHQKRRQHHFQQQQQHHHLQQQQGHTTSQSRIEGGKQQQEQQEEHDVLSFRSEQTMRHKRQRRSNNDDESSFSTSVSLVPQLSLSVRRVGASVAAVQDAGTYQMLHDEFTYLCSTIVTTKNLARATEAALDLALLLSSRKTRLIVWKGDSISTSTSTATTKKTKTVLHSILNLFASTSSLLPPQQQQQQQQQQQHLSNSKPPGSNGSTTTTTTTGTKRRTKNARMKTENSAAALSSSIMPQQMKQALACILYYLSWDCTLSEQQSAATIGAVKTTSSLPRKLRLIILRNAPSLQGFMRLVLQDDMEQVNVDPSKSGCLPHHQHKTRKKQQKQLNGNVLDSNTSNNINNSRRQPQYKQQHTQSSCSSVSYSISANLDHQQQLRTVAESPASSSLTFPEDESSLVSSSMTTFLFQEGDPTTKGRRARRNKRQYPSKTTTIKQDLSFASSSSTERSMGNAGGGTRTDACSKSTTVNNAKEEELDSSSSLQPSTTTTTIIDSVPSHLEPQSVDSTTYSFQSQERPATTSKLDDKIELLVSRIKLLRMKSDTSHGKGGASPMQEASGGGECDHDPYSNPKQGASFWASSLALQSLQRIITGKDHDCRSIHDGNEQEEIGCTEEDDDDDDDDDSSGQGTLEHNPVLLTNKLLGKSKIVPLLGLALSRSLKALVQLTSSSSSSCCCCSSSPLQDDAICHHCCCLAYLYDRISRLAVIVDGACLLDASNRRKFCENDSLSFLDGNTQGLVYHLVLTLKHLVPVFVTDRQEEQQHDLTGWAIHQLGDLMLASARTLTSLTHENEVAAEQFIAKYKYVDDDDDDNDVDKQKMYCGLDVVADMLYQLEDQASTFVERSDNPKNSVLEVEHHRYDCTIFCLTILVNVIETGDVRSLLSEICLADGELWLRWFCRWLVDQTASFRDAVLGSDKKEEGSSSSSSSLISRNTKRELQKQEEDRLVAAGNGCVLLACLMIEPKVCSATHDSLKLKTIRRLILEEMPENDDNTSSGVTLILNTLKAFCNFYHYSVGDLSIAVVRPVAKLIEELEKLK